MIKDLLMVDGVWQGILLFVAGMATQFILIVILGTIMKLREYDRKKKEIERLR